MRRWIEPIIATFGLFLLIAIIAPASYGQINGVPASVTSPGFGGRAINGTPASVTSLGPRGFSPNAPPAGRAQFFSTVPSSDSHRGHHHRHNGNFFPLYGTVYPVPVAVPYPVETQVSEDAEEEESNYQGGPTVFDRRGRGEQSYVPPAHEAVPAHSESEAVPVAENEQPQEPTLLVFKDGHELEVGNYAIVGQTLFDLTPGHARKVALADLDLPSTQKKNDERGGSFQLPIFVQAN